MIRKYLCLMFVLSAFGCSEQQEKPLMTYRKYLDLKDSCVKGYELLSNGDISAAKAEYAKCAQLVEYETTGLLGVAECLAYLDQCDSAMIYAQYAFEKGLPWKNVDTLLFDVHQLRDIYKSARATYFSRVDTALVAELEEMVRKDQKYRLTPDYIYNDSLVRLQAPLDSANRRRFDEITNSKGWPGKRLLGYGILPNIKIVAMHSDHANTLRYLKIAMDAAERNETSWSDAEGLMAMLLFKFEKKEGFNKLRFVTINQDGSLSLDQSYFQLNCLARLKSNNPYPVEIFPTYYEKIPSVDPTKALYEIKNFLVDQGIPASIIHVDSKWQEVEDDGLGKFMFGFRTLQ